MKKKHTLTLILLLAALTLAAQSNYSPCYTNNIAKGDAAFKQGKYSEAKTYYATAKQCAGGNPSVAQQKINSCDAKIKAQREAAEAKRKAEAEAAERKRIEEEAKRKAEAEAAKAKQFQELKSKSSYSNGVLTIDGVVYKMVYVQGGTFTMGCTSEQGSDCLDWEKPSHSVTLSDFWIGETEVTQGLWKAVMGMEPSFDGGWEDKYGKGNSYPAYRVSWDDCQEFIQRLNQLTGMTFRLPSEAEWEYAARGGNKSRGYKHSGSNIVGEVAWFWQNSGDRYLEKWPNDGLNTNNCKSHIVKTKKPNELGLYDMSGNVWEYCQDWYSRDYYSVSPSRNPTGPSMGSDHVKRGGGWDNSVGFCYVMYRIYAKPSERRNNVGFRLVLVP